jgi:hypothetical protein
MISERQKELAGWFGNFCYKNQVNLGKQRLIKTPQCVHKTQHDQYLKKHDDDSVSCVGLGPWLDADWCVQFLNLLRARFDTLFSYKASGGLVQLSHPQDKGIEGQILFIHGSHTQQLQESVMQSIIWLPEESKQVIKGMK